MNLNKTPLYELHKGAGATMVSFGGWEMPVHYATGILQEHLATRKTAGLFDVSHMGRFTVSGQDSLAFLQHVLSNNAAALQVLESQYTFIPTESGGAVDDAYLYRFIEEEYFLVVNAGNREKDWVHFQGFSTQFPNLNLVDQTKDIAMLSLQGPASKDMLRNILEDGDLPEPLRNQLSIATIAGTEVRIARTGYTGEPIGFELFFPAGNAVRIWNLLETLGATPVGLGARDTLRLEAALPLYGHELGMDAENREIPVFALSIARVAVSLSPLKFEFIGKNALTRQFHAMQKIINRDYTSVNDLPKMIRPVEITGKGIARAGDKVFAGKSLAGYITSGTMVPYWMFDKQGIYGRPLPQQAKRAIGLALVSSQLQDGDEIQVEVRGKRIGARIVPFHLRTEAPPYARPITCHDFSPIGPVGYSKATPLPGTVTALMRKAIENTRWRQQDCINLIPSEMTSSDCVRMLSIMDPAGRYAEHKPLKAFCDAEVFYYQGTDFIAEIEALLIKEFRKYLECAEVEPRVLSGQMANATVFSAIVDFLNRSDRKSEQRRIRSIMNHHIIKGGHLSSQPMGALRDFVARDPETERPAVVNFPVLPDNPYQTDIAATRMLIDRYKPELIIFGKSMVLHKEPVSEIRDFITDMEIDCLLMYDMAHVLGLVGPYFQQPFQEGAHIVTGSTHKTFFGTQRGMIAANYQKDMLGWQLWEAIQRRSFPGSTSNHHLGTLLGLLMAAYEMNAFKDEYQQNVISNAKAFAKALKACGLNVAGDPDIGFTQTHQVVVNVGYAKAPEIAKRLEENNIILNYQATPEEEGFTVSGALRMGVAEMTRFGMAPADFKQLAEWMYDVIVKDLPLKDKVAGFRKRFLKMNYCFRGDQLDELLQQVHGML
ncbi:MAG: glycine cleavage system aminomethyltransferase GcvT [Desulfobacterales bacterium]|nr:glycine cleavage system aminomethyltransferase GcvT [Desulfobacterales bacterium]